MRSRQIIQLVILLGLLIGCVPRATSTFEPTTSEVTNEGIQPDIPWWKTAVFYEIFVRSFYDSDGDGIGDFNGITEKLDYLNDGDPETHGDLGITAIWLMPINPSPSYHGYDVVNYYNVDPEYGSMNDFQRLLDEAHKRGIKIIIDLVLNHTSSDHPFFMNASSDENNEYHDWYVWSAENGGNHWHFSGTGANSQYFYGYFSPNMPDLNYQNPEVTEQMEKVTAFWLEDVGVDGFRVDAAKHLIEDGKVLENTQATHDWFKGFYDFYKSINPDAYVVGEVSGSDARVSELYDDDEMDMIFNFEVASGFVNSANGGSISGIGSAVTFIEKDNPDWNFATFLTNHDQNRVMSTLGGNVEKAKVAAALMLTSPGTPFIYYGEEIGMEGIKPDEYIRRPMQWNYEQYAGFTTGDPWEEIGENYSTVNVELQTTNENSLLNWYRQLIQLREEYPVFSSGGYTAIKCSDRGVYAALRESEEATILVLINMSKKPVADFTLSFEGASLPDGRYSSKPILGNATITDMVVTTGKSPDYKPGLSLEPFQTILLQLIPAE